LFHARPGQRRDIKPARRVSSVTIGPVRPSRALQRHPLTLWEYGAIRRHHASCCAPYGFPSTPPSSQCTDDNQTGSSHTATLKAATGWIQGRPRRPTSSKILQDGRLLYKTVRHTATCNYNSVARLPAASPWPIKGGGSPPAAGRIEGAHFTLTAFTTILELCLNHTSGTWRSCLLSHLACCSPLQAPRCNAI
jgi:hypothetical protein